MNSFKSILKPILISLGSIQTLLLLLLGILHYHLRVLIDDYVIPSMSKGLLLQLFEVTTVIFLIVLTLITYLCIYLFRENTNLSELITSLAEPELIERFGVFWNGNQPLCPQTMHRMFLPFIDNHHTLQCKSCLHVVNLHDDIGRVITLAQARKFLKMK